MILVSSCICLCPFYWSRVLSREWRCSWSSADRRCSNYIWVINNLMAYKGASFIRDLSSIPFPLPLLFKTAPIQNPTYSLKNFNLPSLSQARTQCPFNTTKVTATWLAATREESNECWVVWKTNISRLDFQHKCTNEKIRPILIFRQYSDTIVFEMKIIWSDMYAH